jgi:EmrB/QacA subfamily drug resistance transporter
MRKWAPLLTICLSTFMLLLDVTIVSVAIPSIATALKSSFAALQWSFDLYVLVLAALLLAVGSASDRLGRRFVFVLGLGVFTLASLACGLAPTSAVLIIARGAQGVGAAAMLATNAALIGSSYAGRDRGTAFGVWGGVMGAASAAGPILGGLLTEHLTWRAIFLVNIPVGILAIVLALRTVNESRNPASGRIDLPGTVTFTAAVTLLVYGLIEAGDQGWTERSTLIAFGGAALCLIGFVALETGRRYPMLDLALFRRPSFAALMLAGAALHLAAFGNIIYVSIWAQSLLGMSPVTAGLVLTPLSGVAFVIAVFAGRRLHHVGPQYLIGIGLVLIGIGALLNLVLLTGNASWPVLLPGLCLTGVGVGLASPVVASATLAAAPPERAGMATGAINTFRQLGFAFAVPLFATVLASGARQVLGASGLYRDPSTAAVQLAAGRGRAMLAGTQGPHDLVVGTLHQAYAAGLDRIFGISAVVGILTGLVVVLVVKPSPRPAWQSGAAAGGAGSPGAAAAAPATSTSR